LMNILFATQGKYGERIVEYIAANRPQEWKILRLPLRRNLPAVIDDPEEVLPATVPAADLLVSLHESPGAAELIPDIAQRCGAVAVLAAVDDRAACPRGLENQIGKRLGEVGVAFSFARPLCGFDGGPHPLLSAFASLFGRPIVRIDADGDRVGRVTVERDCPCGAGRFVAKVLPGTRLSEAADTGALRHHHHPCMASMEVDPELSDTLMHLSGYLFRAAINKALQGK
jgi:thymidylate synthase